MRQLAIACVYTILLNSRAYCLRRAVEYTVVIYCYDYIIFDQIHRANPPRADILLVWVLPGYRKGVRLIGE